MNADKRAVMWLKCIGGIKRRHEPGMVSSEWALTAPLFMMVALVCIAVVVYTNNLALTTNAAREAARSYSLGRGEEESKDAAWRVAGKNAQIDIRQDGEFVEVTVKKPPVPSLNFLGITVQSSHTALMEPGM